MKVTYNGKGINTKQLLNCLKYVMAVIDKRPQGGFLNKIALNNSLTLEQFEMQRRGISYQINQNLCPLGIATLNTKGGYRINKKTKEKINKKNLYTINKDLFLIWFFFCEAAESLNEKTVKQDKCDYDLDFELQPVISSLINSMKIMPVGKLYFYKSNKTNPRAKYLEERYINHLVIYYHKSMYSLVNKTSFLNKGNYFYLTLSSKFYFVTLWNDYTLVIENLDSTSIDTSIIETNSSLSYLSPYVDAINSALYYSGRKSTVTNTDINKQWFTNELLLVKPNRFNIERLFKKVNRYKYQSKESIIKQFSNIDLYTLKPIVVYTDKLSKQELQKLKMDFAVFLCKHSVYFKELHRLIHYLNEHGRLINLRLNIEATYHKKDSYYAVEVTCRQNNQLCLMKTATRKEVLSDMGFSEKDSFDLHGAIFSVARLINKGEWSCEWDIKKDLASKKWVDDDGVIVKLEKEELRPLLYRSFFTKGFEDTYKRYKSKRKKEDKKVKRFEEEDKKQDITISETVFKQVFDNCQKWTGGTFELTSNIFVIESLIELAMLAQHEMVEGLENVYDCFYFSPFLHEEDIKEELDSIAIGTRNMILKWKEDGLFNLNN